ncbi:MAG TPA: futalosine hydrolase [Candidatus Cybelea sp.]|nr:futalosine hydrolase [Candidatus Cybelea sp.]
MILLACAVEAELRFWEPRDDVATLVMGVGPVEASCALTAALCERRYRLVVNAGLAGAFDGIARVGDAVIVAEDMMELGLESGAPLRLPSGERTFDTARSVASLVARLGGKDFLTVRGITVSRVTSTEQTARRLAAELGAQVESMEGFAALRAAERMGVPAIELRGISNRCGERASSGWDFDAGIAGLARITRSLLELA